MKKKKKVFLISAVVFLITIIIFSFLKLDFYQTKEFLKRNLDPRVFAFFQLVGDIERSTKKLNNDYNTIFLPKTQFLELSFKKIDISNNFKNANEVGYAQNLKQKVRQSFYLDYYNGKIFFLSSQGQLFFNYYPKIEINNQLININTNLNLHKALDLFINKNKIYISGVIKYKNCLKLTLYEANINQSNILNFENIFISKECAKKNIQGGKISKIFNKDSLLLTTAADILINKDESDPKPQDDNSIYGKILEIDLNKKDYKIFSKGHRNALGLYSDGEVILATENGPRGGDEINRIVFNQNYGWPKVSYGYKYKSNETYSNLHAENGFKEPIFTFIPSIGISQIIKIENNFSKEWQNNFLISSLNGNHLYRIKFGKNFEKVIFMEKIYIGERMRDLIYLKDHNVILIALESSGSLGVLKNN